MAVIESLIHPERPITFSDLEKFKVELLSDIANLLKSDSVQPKNKWLKSKEVKKLLKISPGTLQNLRIKGVLSFTKNKK